jgi:hypothetical protein
MNVFLRAVVTGFGFSLGAALFRKVSSRLGLNDDKSAKEERPENKVDPGAVARQDGGSEAITEAGASVLLA